jgi:hypothetical protein
LQITKVAASAERPANVAVYIDVHDSNGKPVPGLNEQNFRILEDGKLVPPAKAKRALLDTSSFAARYTMLLVDLSGPIVDSEDLPELATSVGRFVDRVGAVGEVAVGAFDGSDEVAPFLGFGATAETAAVVDGIRHFRPHNRNTNLNGAVYQGLHALREKLAESKASEKSAALVVFTDRGDLSHTVSAETLKQGMDESAGTQIFIIGAGEKINRPELTAIGRTSALLSTDPKAFKKSFEEVTQKLSANTNGRYVLSYCSPKRRGDHKVEIEVVTPHDKGRAGYRFNADGFGSGCSPKRKPSFSMGGGGEGGAQEAAKDAKPAKPPKQPKDQDQEDGES